MFWRFFLCTAQPAQCAPTGGRLVSRCLRFDIDGHACLTGLEHKWRVMEQVHAQEDRVLDLDQGAELAFVIN